MAACAPRACASAAPTHLQAGVVLVRVRLEEDQAPDALFQGPAGARAGADPIRQHGRPVLQALQERLHSVRGAESLLIELREQVLPVVRALGTQSLAIGMLRAARQRRWYRAFLRQFTSWS